MMVSKKDKGKGFTLPELVISIILLAMASLIIGVIFNTTFVSRELIDREVSIQAEMRSSMQLVNKTVENATAIFILDDSKYNPSDSSVKLTDGWNYIGLSEDGKKVINYVWNNTTSRWDISEFGTYSTYNMRLDLTFESTTDYEDNRLVKYDLTGQYLNSNNKLEIDTAIMALNSKQIFSRVSKGKKGVAIAYRSDPIQGQMSTAVTFVFDTSGSMAWDLQGNRGITRSYYEPMQSKSRMAILKEKAKIMVDNLAEVGNVSVNLVNFSTIAGYIQEDFVNLDGGTAKAKQSIENMKSEGLTNPGDGMRFGMVSLQKVSAQFKYVVLLSDGLPNVYRIGEGGYSRYTYNYRDEDNGAKAYNPYTYFNPSFELSNKITTNYYLYAGNNTFHQDAITYVGEVTKTFGTGVKRVNFIGFSGKKSDKDKGQEMTDLIVSKGVEAKYYDASNDAELERVFADIKKQIEQDLWFVKGP